MIYETLAQLGRTDPESMLASSDIDQVRLATASLSTAEDTNWAEAMLLNLLQHPDKWVTNNAISGLTDLARVIGLSQPDTVAAAFRQLMVDRPKHAGHAQVGLEDLQLFAGRQLR